MMVLITGMIVLIFLIVVFNQKIKHKIFIKNKKEPNMTLFYFL